MKFILSPVVVLERVLPTPVELVYGYRHGWIDDFGVVKIAERQLASGIPLPSVIEDVGLLLSDQLHLVFDLMSEAAEDCGSQEPYPSTEDPSRVWLYLALEWLYVHRERFDDPLEVIEMLYADFDYPDEVRRFVRFMPLPENEVGGSSIEERWARFLSERRTHYANRIGRAVTDQP